MKKHAGFTLLELAIALVIIGMMLGGLMMPLLAQQDQRNLAETRSQLAFIRSALTGFAASHRAADSRPYLPCPDTSGDGSEDRDTATGACSATDNEGGLPWMDLGLGRSDAWGRDFRYRVDPDFANSTTGFTFSSPASLVVLQAAGAAKLADKLPLVVVSHGKLGEGTGADERENSDGDGSFVSHEPVFAGENQFDDLVIWLPAPLLFSQMVDAGALP
jgi:prepilin-type N-terminal cleavage/methylation domain-containing protein